MRLEDAALEKMLQTAQKVVTLQPFLYHLHRQLIHEEIACDAYGTNTHIS